MSKTILTQNRAGLTRAIRAATVDDHDGDAFIFFQFLYPVFKLVCRNVF